MADLSNIDAEMKRINELTDKYKSLLQIEREVNQTMLYSSGVRKKYSDALSAASEIQKDIIKQERDYEKSLVSNSKSLNDNLAIHKKLEKKQSKLLKEQKGLKKDSEEYKENAKRLKEYEKSLESAKNAIDNYEKAMKENIKNAEEIKDKTKGLKKVFDDLAKLDGTKVSSQKDLNNLTKQRISLMREQFSIQEQSGVLSADESKRLKEKLGQIEEMQGIQGDLIKGSVSEDLAPMIDDITKQATELTNPKRFKKNKDKEIARAREAAESRAGLSLKGQQASSLKAIFSGKTSFGDKLKAIKSYRDAGKDLGKLNEVMEATGRSALGTGNMMKMLSSALGSLGKLGWIGLIAQAVTAVANAVNDLDKFLKGFNQTFAKLHGPTVMMKDVDKSMSEFTNSIFNLQRNLKYGLKSEDIVGMFQGISESGMSLQGILQKVSGGYNKVIEESAKIHLNFGVSMEEAGSMLGEQMTDLRSSLDEASEGFKVLSYDASIAGIQSQKFYQATYAAAEALSYYGNFLSSASNTLKKFQTQGAMGFKDAQKQTQEITNLFKSMSMTQRTMFIDMTGGVKFYTEIFDKKLSENNDQIEKHNDILKVRKEALVKAEQAGNTKAVDELKNLISAEEQQLASLKKNAVMYESALSALSKGAIQDVAAYLPMLSDMTMKLTGNFFNSIRSKAGGIDIFEGDERAIMEQLSQISGMSNDLVLTYLTTAKMNKKNIEDLGKEMGDTLNKLDVDKRQGIGAILTDFKNRDSVDLKELETELKKYLNENEVGKVMENFSKLPESLSVLINEGHASLMGRAKELAISDTEGLKIVIGEKEADQATRLDKLVKNTRTIEDFIGINKENAKYFLASNDLQKKAAESTIFIARSTGAMLTFVQGIANKMGVGGAKTEEEFRQSEDYEALRINLEKEMILKKEIERTPEEDTERRKKLEDKLKQVEGIKKGVGGMNLYQQDELVGIAAERVDKLYEDKARLDKQVSMLEKKAKNSAGEERAKLEELIWAIKEDFKKRTYTLDIADTSQVEEKKDYKAQSGGYALLSKGDVVVNARSMSTGVGGDIGAFAGTAASSLMKNISSGQSPMGAPQIPVNINIGSVSGDPEEFLQRIKPAIEQAFERMYYDKQKRV